MDEPDPVGNHEARLGVPARIVEDEKDDAPNARAGFLREGVEKRLQEGDVTLTCAGSYGPAATDI